MASINNNPQAEATFEQEVVYKECNRNHAASLGKASFDGCCEFIGGGGENGAKDDMLCAACNCHRSFHHKYTIRSPVGQRQAGQSGYHMQFKVNRGTTHASMLEIPSRRKKRTVYKTEEKIKMTRFAEKLGWKPQKSDNEEIEGFCLEMGISRKMFLVWVSNNRRKALEKSTTPKN